MKGNLEAGIRNQVRTARTALFASLFTVSCFLFPSAAAAGSGDMWRGGAWSGNTGWILMNCLSDSSLPDPCNPGAGGNNYGVDIDTAVASPTQKPITGWAWSGNIGWVCFGATCGGVTGLTPEGVAPYAYVNPASGYDFHGWANVVAFGASGWISLNCADMLAGCTTFKVKANYVTGVVSGFGWNGNADGTGIGWVDFSPSALTGIEVLCADGIDNDADGLIDCADPDCAGQNGPPTCGAPYICGPEDTAPTCQDGCDNDGDSFSDCQDATACTGVAAFGCPLNEDLCTDPGGADACCSNGLDDDQDGLWNCADPDCFGDDSCPSDEAMIVSCQPPEADGGGVPNVGGCCANLVDDDAAVEAPPDVPGALDCADLSCSAYCTGKCAANNAITCIYDWQCPADINGIKKCQPTYYPWLESLLNDIYSKQQISSTNRPPQNKYNATFCLLTPIGSGGIVNFFSDPLGACASPPTTPAVNAPTGSVGYSTIYGRLDLAGILSGSYGQVVTLGATLTGAQPAFGGKIFFRDGDLTVGPASFVDAAGGTSGAGLIVVRGTLTIAGDVTYAVGAGVPNLSNLASAGYLVVKRADGTGGNVVVAPTVTGIAGAIFAENAVSTGVSANPLTIYGPVVARSFAFERTFLDPVRGSEQVIYDSRTLLNPPPGLSDVSKALPSFRLGN